MSEMLEGKVAIVTGAGSGAGRAIALALAAKGVKVAAVGRTLAKVEETVALANLGSVVGAYQADVGNADDVATLIPKVVADLGPIEILVNNAGINIRNRGMDVLSQTDWDEVIRINLTGPFLMMSGVLPGMRTRQSGLIVNISSISANRSSPLGGAAYCASKFGLNGLAGTVSQEEAKHGIRCTLISPGEINTPILDQRPVPVSAEQRAADLQPEDIAAAVCFIAELPPRAHVFEMVIKPTAIPYA